jgi:hypothetical protein
MVGPRGDSGVALSSLLVLAVLTQTPSAPPAEAAAPAVVNPAPEGMTSIVPDWSTSDLGWGFQTFTPRVGVQHRTRGYGYNRGYTSLETFVPLIQDEVFWMTAFQGNFVIDNGGELGTNIGLVNRRYVEGMDRIFGFNSFYTYRKEDGSPFNQIGLGIETLGPRVDWRMNGYLPVGDDLFIARNTQITYAAFSGRDVLINFLANKALAGFDTEWGVLIPSVLDNLRAYGGFYHFRGDNSRDLWGIQGRLEAQIQDSMIVHCGITNDRTFGTNVVVGAGFYFPGAGPKSTTGFGRVADRMAQAVWRNDNITIERGELKAPIPATWRDGSRIDVVHVDSTVPAGGDGSLLNPVNTLTAAQALDGPGSLLFVRANSTFTGEGVVLQDRQQLLGEGIDHIIQSQYGPFLLPTVTDPADIQTLPSMSNAPGNAVVVANDAVVSGFNIITPAGSGIVGDNVQNVQVDHVQIGGAGGDGIALTNASGVLSFTDNFLLSNVGRGLSVQTSVADSDNSFIVSDNTILQNGGIGVELAANGESNNTLVMEKNLVRVVLGPTANRTDPLVQISSTASSSWFARVENNDIKDFFNRDNTSPTDDPYYHQLVASANQNSEITIGVINNRFESDRNPLNNNPANGSFGLRLQTSDLAGMQAVVKTNSSTLNYAFVEDFGSTLVLEDVLSTNTSGTFFYFPTANFIDLVPADSIDLP